MAHSALNRGKLLDQLKFAEENGSPAPTDDEVMRLCGFTSPEQARTLYADLADRGLIRIAVVSGARRVAIVEAQERKIAAGGDGAPKRVQLNLGPSRATYLTIKERAERAGVAPGRYALDLLEGALSSKPTAAPQMVPMAGKPMIRASVQRAAREAGEPLPDFVTRLIDLGLECWSEGGEVEHG